MRSVTGMQISLGRGGGVVPHDQVPFETSESDSIKSEEDESDSPFNEGGAGNGSGGANGAA